MPKVFIVTGISNSGKDEVCRILSEMFYENPTQNVKFSLPFKLVLCDLYDISLQQIANKQFRQQLVPDMDINWSELMDRWYQYVPLIDPDMMIRKVMRQVDSYRLSGYNLVFTDIRKTRELSAVLDSVGNNIHHIALYRHGYSGRTTDGNLGEIRQTLAKVPGIVNYHIDNDGSIHELENELTEILG